MGPAPPSPPTPTGPDQVLTDRLTALGQLAISVAHEVNTPVQFVGDNLHFLRQVVAGFTQVLDAYRASRALLPAATQAQLAAIEAEVDLEFLRVEAAQAIDASIEGLTRVAEIVGALRALMHPGHRAHGLIDVADVVTRAITIARGEVRPVATVALDLAPALPPVRAHGGELQQVVLNLIVNAAHAIADHGGGPERRGLITIGTTARDDRVVITVADTGGGIPPAIRARVFEPFFTTKAPGRGCGIGLALARTIIERHHGALRFECDDGVGTRFHVELPIAGPS